jgi:hypothetical protein
MLSSILAFVLFASTVLNFLIESPYQCYTTRGYEAPQHIQKDNSRSHELKHAVPFREIYQS